MLEKDLCTIIGHSLDWHYKIPDIGNCRKPFDGFGTLNGKPVYYEAKFLKKPQAFDLQRIEDHQIQSLLDIKKVAPDAICAIILGVDYGRADKRVYVFQDLDNLNYRRTIRKNYLKKELVTLPYYKIKKGVIDFTNLITPIT